MSATIEIHFGDLFDAPQQRIPGATGNNGTYVVFPAAEIYTAS